MVECDSIYEKQSMKISILKYFLNCCIRRTLMNFFKGLFGSKDNKNAKQTDDEKILEYLLNKYSSTPSFQIRY